LPGRESVRDDHIQGRLCQVLFHYGGALIAQKKTILILQQHPGIFHMESSGGKQTASLVASDLVWRKRLRKEREMMRRKEIYFNMVAMVISLALLAIASPARAADPVATAVDEFLSTLPKDFYMLSAKGLKAALDAGEPILVVDVRESLEFEAGHIEEAIHIPPRQLAQKLDQLPPDKNSPLAVICRTGGRSSYGTMALWLLGYRNLRNIAGGMQGWEKEGFPTAK